MPASLWWDLETCCYVDSDHFRFTLSRVEEFMRSNGVKEEIEFHAFYGETTLTHSEIDSLKHIDNLKLIPVPLVIRIDELEKQKSLNIRERERDWFGEMFSGRGFRAVKKEEKWKGSYNGSGGEAVLEGRGEGEEVELRRKMKGVMGVEGGGRSWEVVMKG